MDFADFGATQESVKQLERLFAEAPVSPNPRPRRSRLAQKMEFAKQIRALKTASIRSPENDAEIERLTNALYDL